jgi:hypothetical protein
MMRRWAIAAVAGLAVLALAAPAQAKGDASRVTVTNGGGSGPGGIGGPGGSGSGNSGSGGSGGGTAAAVLTAPMHLQGVDAAGWIADTGVFQASESHPAAGGLGPALDVRVEYTCGPGRGGVISQQLFPYARGGAVAHTMAGQRFCDGPLTNTWWRVADNTMNVLHDNGLPATMPKAAVNPVAGSGAGTGAGAGGSAARAASPAGSSSGAPVLPLALGIAAIVAVGGFAVIQMRRRRTVAA